MKIKRYIVKNMKEALYLIKQDLGSEAIIVSSHKVKAKGIKGLFSPRKLEVTAAVEQKDVETANIEAANNKPLSPSVGILTMHKIRQSLLDMEIEPEVVDFILKDLDLLSGNNSEIQRALQARIQSIFKPSIVKKRHSNIMAFIGSPGVGKTTTLAKIAAIYSLFNSFSIGFITIDTYRVGAVEQMRIYGDIIGATVDVVMSPTELRQAIDRNQDKDLILIDTAGRPSKNLYQLAELKNFLEAIDVLDIYLVLSATTKKRDMIRILNDYKIIPYSQLIITKMDETELPGSIINAAYLTGLPIAYITNGQDVPDDIEVAGPELLASFVMRDVVY